MGGGPGRRTRWRGGWKEGRSQETRWRGDWKEGRTQETTAAAPGHQALRVLSRSRPSAQAREQAMPHRPPHPAQHPTSRPEVQQGTGHPVGVVLEQINMTLW